MRIISLASGSSGNALLIEAGPQGRTRLLVDAGLSARLLTQRLQSVNVRPEQLQGVLVTHEHGDHVQAIPTLARRYATPIYADARTLSAIEEGVRTGTWRSDSGKMVFAQAVEDLAGEPQPASTLTLTPLPAGSQRTIGDIEVTSFPISHDAVAPCGYFLQSSGCRVCVITDSGVVTAAMLPFMRQADVLVLESNHDREKLRRGPYPWSLKQRILGATGHLANDQAAAAVLQAWAYDSIRWLWLAHLSRTNNTPALACESMQVALQGAGASLDQIHISALPPGLGPIWDSTRLWHTPSLFSLSSNRLAKQIRSDSR